MGSPTPPLPLEGEGAGGWGESADLTSANPEGANASRVDPRSVGGSTPSQLSPLEGEGYRYAKRRRIADGGVRRARRLRKEMTVTERKLWDYLRTFPVRFRRQAPIGPYVADFACHRARLVVEVDGGVHELPDVAARDLKRDEWFAGQGYRVLRFAARQIDMDLETVVAAIRAAAPSLLANEQLAPTPSQTLPPRGEGL